VSLATCVGSSRSRLPAALDRLLPLRRPRLLMTLSQRRAHANPPTLQPSVLRELPSLLLALTTTTSHTSQTKLLAMCLKRLATWDFRSFAPGHSWIGVHSTALFEAFTSLDTMRGTTFNTGTRPEDSPPTTTVRPVLKSSISSSTTPVASISR